MMKSLNLNSLNRCIASLLARRGEYSGSTGKRAFTLIELILVLALLVIITSIAAPSMANFVRGRALDSEARRMIALMHAAQSRAVSEGLPMVLWVDEKQNAYGMQAETTGQTGKSVGGFNVADRGVKCRRGHTDNF